MQKITSLAQNLVQKTLLSSCIRNCDSGINLNQLVQFHPSPSLFIELFEYHTDPLKSDTDGDGVSDGDEVWVEGTDPLFDGTRYFYDSLDPCGDPTLHFTAVSSFSELLDAITHSGS